VELTSISNDKVKYWEKLKDKKNRDSENLFLVESDHLVDEALKNNLVKEIITTDNTKKYNVPTYYVNDKIMNKLSLQTSKSNIIAVCKKLEEKPIYGNIIVLDRLQDPGNLGTIIRSAVAFSFDTLVLSEDSVDLYNPKVIRASEGMLFNLNIIRTNIKEFLNNLDSHYLKIATNVNSGQNINDLKYDKCAIVIGNEGNGISSDIANICDEFVKIPMNSNCESLNAGVSASILMYEVYNEQLR
jgi:TrmH family RNA methyltransferase